jgi:hypothetical protein
VSGSKSADDPSESERGDRDVGRDSIPRDLPGWYLSAYPGAGEATGVFRGTGRKPRGRLGPLPEDIGNDRSRRLAASRARVVVRRYCAANRLNRLGTLTYAGDGCHDPFALRKDVAQFFVRLRTAIGGKNFPYLWVPEWHKTDHGLHVHFAVGQYVRRSLIEDAWGRGYVHIKLLGNLPVGSTSLDEARKAAGYLSKYVGKAIDEGRIPGLHRYEVAEGFPPEQLRIYGPNLSVALSRVVAVMGGRPGEVSMSNEWKDWTGPRAVSVRWAS